MRLYALPILGDQPIDNIGYKDVRAVIVALADTGKKESAKKLHGVMNQLFSYAEIRDHCEENVVNFVKFKKGFFKGGSSRKFPTITEPTKVKVLIENIKNFKGGHYSTKQGLLFMALTSLRSANVRSAKWEYINADTHTMTIPKEEMKIEKSKLPDHEDFVLPLAAQTMELLSEVKKHTGHGTYIFPSIRGDRPMSENAMLAYIRNLGYTKEEFTPHGFRAMFATIANDKSKFNRDLVDSQLAHKVGGSVSQVYNRTDYLQKRRALVQWWENWLNIN